MNFHIPHAISGKIKTFKTERGIINHVMARHPNAHEAFISHGDILIMRDGKAIAILDGKPVKDGIRFNAIFRLVRS